MVLLYRKSSSNLQGCKLYLCWVKTVKQSLHLLLVKIIGMPSVLSVRLLCVMITIGCCENGVNINFYVCDLLYHTRAIYRKPNFHCTCVDLSWKAFMLVSCFLSETIDFSDRGEYVFWNIIEFCLKWWRCSWDNMSSETSTSQICNLIKLFYFVILFSKLT